MIAGGEILGLAISCRVLGMGVEHVFLRHVLEPAAARAAVRGRIIPTPRNVPVRHLYRDNGFTETEPGVWEYRCQAAA